MKDPNPLAQENVATLGSDLWATPRRLVELLMDEFPIGIDLAAAKKTRVCERYWGPDQEHPFLQNALARDWKDAGAVGFVNPPFSLLEKFAYTAAASAAEFTTVALLPVKTETKWWHATVPLAQEVRFLKGRLSYLDPETLKPVAPARFASAVVVWAPVPTGLRTSTRVSYWDWRAK